MTRDAEERKDALKRRVRRVRRHYARKGAIAQLALSIAGVALVVIGTALLVLPGPAFLVIPTGLALLSVRFAWASRLVDTAIDAGVDATEVVKRASRSKKIMFGLAVACLAAAVVAFFAFQGT